MQVSDFRKFYREHRHRLFAFLMRCTGDYYLAGDILQRGFGQQAFTVKAGRGTDIHRFSSCFNGRGGCRPDCSDFRTGCEIKAMCDSVPTDKDGNIGRAEISRFGRDSFGVSRPDFDDRVGDRFSACLLNTFDEFVGLLLRARDEYADAVERAVSH